MQGKRQPLWLPGDLRAVLQELNHAKVEEEAAERRPNKRATIARTLIKRQQTKSEETKEYKYFPNSRTIYTKLFLVVKLHLSKGIC